MIPAMTYLYILLGLVVGVISGIVGIGGGILIIPALVYFFHMSQHKAQGTSLTALLAPIGALAFWEYYKAGNVDLKAGLLIALGFLVGGLFRRTLGPTFCRNSSCAGRLELCWQSLASRYYFHPEKALTIAPLQIPRTLDCLLFTVFSAD
jgi:hypothetical protein